VSDRICSFGELTPAQKPLAGGKGGTLAQLYQAGYPVPEGFVLLPAAFSGDHLAPEAWAEAQTHLRRLRKNGNGSAFAVRSSALSEDSALASFAGEFETVLDVHTDETVRAAIHTVRRSRHAERVRVYSQAQGIEAVHDMAVVVQQLVRADISGVLFTADPVTGSHMQMMGNYVYGFGEELVSGEAEPYTFTMERPKGRYNGPPALRRFARKLYKMASRLQRDLARPQDIEWAIADGRLYLLQSRPITTLIGHNPATGEQNDSLVGDFLWSNTNLGEAFIDPLTPFTYSVAMLGAMELIPGQLLSGNICGRLYFNISMIASMYSALGLKSLSLEKTETSLGRLPEGIEIPMIPFSLPYTLRNVMPKAIKTEMRQARCRKKLPEWVASNREQCVKMEQWIQETQTKEDLAALWSEKLEAYHIESIWMIKGPGSLYVDLDPPLRAKLTKLVGATDANTLLSKASSQSELLASLGPVAGLAKVARGEMSREEYLAAFGHRGPHEMELSIPRPIEEPGWLDQQLAEWQESPTDVDALLERQRAEFDAAWQRLEKRYPRKAKSIHRRIEQIGSAARDREASRSEGVRTLGVVRAFALRAGELTGLGDDIFLLSIDEVLDVLLGNEATLAAVTAYLPTRRVTYARYKALPALPTLIRGRFDPFEWAADPKRRSDIFDASAPLPVSDSDTVNGFAGAMGRVEGLVRRLNTPEEGRLLQKGEILVTEQTNVGWTLLFPRAAAIVTDVGAPLSHAAIVARELGIPAVVGCGNATMRLHTGDRVCVDGGRGIVEILETV
jgi:phosphohistidine swiveling domain-containing protein